MNYEEMSDFAINQAVTCEVFGCHDWEINSCGDFYHCGSDGSGHFVQTVNDYCNNPSDAWPIILENKICVMHDVMAEPCDGGSWIAQPSYGYQSERVRNDNPLRAAMIVFLMMKDAQNV